MAYNPSRLYGPSLLTPLASVPVKVFEKDGIIKDILISNLSNGLIRYSLYLAPAGEDAQRSNNIYPDQFIEARAVKNWEMSLVVKSGDKLYMTAAVPNTIVATVSGVEID
jgi:hypothetical protein